jgi:hypothetical protein
VILRLCESEPIQVGAVSLCDPKGSRSVGACKVYVIGRYSIVPAGGDAVPSFSVAKFRRAGYLAFH